MDTSERYRRIEALFDSVVDAPDRESALAAEADTATRDAVRKLLHSYDQWSAATPPAEPATFRCGPWECVAPLGSGGMGTVYRATRADGQFRQQVAVKLLRGALRTDYYRERFYAERQILANLNHPNIARLLDGGVTSDGELYLAMELVEGEPLDAWCSTRNPALAERVTVFRQVLDAVEFAHRNLVVHRDLKPSNILVTPEGAAKLLDFGTSKLLAGDDARTEVAALTPAYASPEQLRGEPVATTSDVYSLGVVLYGLLTGKPPFGRSLDRTPPSPPLNVPPDLAAIVMKALEEDPARRYQSVAALSEDLERYLEGRPVRARGGRWTYLAGKWLRRHRYAVAVGALVLLALGWGLRERTQASQRLEESRRLASYLLFELFDQVSRLPGSTEVRARMAETAQAQLDRLASLPGASDAVRLETAEGYNRLAEVQGVTGSPNLGDPQAAQRSLASAGRILDQLPDNTRALTARVRNLLLRARIELWSNGRTASAKTLVNEAARLAATLPASDNETRHTRVSVLAAQAQVADFEERWADEAKLADEGLRALDAGPGATEETVLQRAALLRHKGNALFYTGRRQQALELYQAAERTVREADTRWPGRPALLALLMISTYDVGTTLDALGRKKEAAPAIARSLDAGRKLIEREERDQTLLRNFGVVREAYAESLADAGRTADAIAEQQGVVEFRTRVASARPGIPSLARDVAFSRFVLGKIQARGGNIAAACASYRTAMSAFDALHEQGALAAWDWNQNGGDLRRALNACR